jgi:CDP-glucose 4,6-dehydratase
MEWKRAFAGRRVFVTGHTGFKGSWLVLWLKRLGAKVAGYSLPTVEGAPSLFAAAAIRQRLDAHCVEDSSRTAFQAVLPIQSPSLFAAARIRQCLDAHCEGDVREGTAIAQAIDEFAPDVIFHLAAQSLVRESHRSPAETFDVNVMGTVAVLEAVRSSGRPCAVVVVTSDKCYENREQVWGYREIDRLGGHDPYSASKGAAEIVVASYRRSFFPPERLAEHGLQIASVRAGNVIGGGDWAADRIVADLARALACGNPVPIRCPGAIRPWQHVLEPLSGYLTLAMRMLTNPDSTWCDGWNFGPEAGDALSVRELAEKFIAAWGTGTWIDKSDTRQPHEARVLRLCIDKALAELGWRPRWTVKQAIERTAGWYRRYYDDPNSARAACEDDLDEYCALDSNAAGIPAGSAAA